MKMARPAKRTDLKRVKNKLKELNYLKVRREAVRAATKANDAEIKRLEKLLAEEEAKK